MQFGPVIKKVERDPYVGPPATTVVADGHAAGVSADRPVSRSPIVQQQTAQATAVSSQPSVPQPATGADFHHRGANAQGIRHQQDSSFTLSGKNFVQNILCNIIASYIIIF